MKKILALLLALVMVFALAACGGYGSGCYRADLQKKTEEKDGYNAVVVGYGETREKLVNKPQTGAFKKAGVHSASMISALFDISIIQLATSSVICERIEQTFSNVSRSNTGKFAESR